MSVLFYARRRRTQPPGRNLSAKFERGEAMTADQLRALQAPVKDRYRTEPASALMTMKAEGTLRPEDLLCVVASGGGPIAAGLHAAAGGDGRAACAGDMLLQALVACAGV